MKHRGLKEFSVIKKKEEHGDHREKTRYEDYRGIKCLDDVVIASLASYHADAKQS